MDIAKNFQEENNLLHNFLDGIIMKQKHALKQLYILFLVQIMVIHSEFLLNLISVHMCCTTIYI